MEKLLMPLQNNPSILLMENAKQFLSKSDPILSNIINQIPELILENTEDVFHDMLSCIKSFLNMVVVVPQFTGCKLMSNWLVLRINWLRNTH